MRFSRAKTIVIVLAALAVGCKKPVPEPVAATPAVKPSLPSVIPTLEDVRPTEPVKPKVDRKTLLNQVNDAVALLTLDSADATKRALIILKNVVNTDDTIAFAHFNAGVAHQQLNQLGAARMAYERALDAEETLATAWLAVGLLQDISGNPSRAIVKYRQGLEYAPEDIDLHVALIGSLRRQNRLNEAIEAAKIALKINANSLAIYNELGLVYLAKNDLDMARFVFSKAFSKVEGAKNNAAIRCNFGRVLYLQGEVARAEHELIEAYALDQKYFSTLVYLAEVHLDNRAYNKALVLLEEAKRQQPDHHGVTINLGLAYRGVGRFADAKRLYEDAIKIDESNPDPYLNLGILYGDYMKQYDQAVEAFNAYITRGGIRKSDAAEYVVKVEKERVRALKKKEQDAVRKKREAERSERERLLKEAEEKAKKEEATKAKGSDPWNSNPSDPATPDPAPKPETPPADDEPASPWETP